MKISELIELLEKLKHDNGDLPVVTLHPGDCFDCDITLTVRSDKTSVCVGEGNYTPSSVEYLNKNPEEICNRRKTFITSKRIKK